MTRTSASAAGRRGRGSPDVLNFCLGLPVGRAVPLEALSPDERAMLDDVQPDVVTVARGTVTRYAVPPLDVDLAMVPVCSWREGLEQAGRFAPFCARAMVLCTPPPDLDEVCVEAAFFGIGVIVVVGDAEPRVLVAPEEFRRSRFTAAGWRFLWPSGTTLHGRRIRSGRSGSITRGSAAGCRHIARTYEAGHVTIGPRPPRGSTRSTTVATCLGGR